MGKEKKEFQTSNPRISNNLVEYIKYIIKRHKQEYGLNVEFTEASNLLAKRAKESMLFK